MSAITFTVGGDSVIGNIYLPDKPQEPAFLFIHGWLGHQNLIAAQAVAELKHPSMTYAMRGQGESEGDITKLTKSDYLDEALSAYDYLRSQVGPTTPIGLVGSSFGCYLSILLSRQRNVQCLSLRVPANYPDNSFNTPDVVSLSARRKLYDDWRSQPRSVSENMALRALNQFSGPVQIIESEKDDQVPHQTVLNYTNAVKDPGQLSYTLMKGALHSLIDQSQQTAYGKLLGDWVQKQ